jgi:integrase
MKQAFTAHIERTSAPLKSGSLQNIAATLVVIARNHLNLGEPELDAMLRVKKKVSSDPAGMTEKNSRRLIQFNDWENVARLVSLPSVLMARANSDPENRMSALCAMHAVALTILLSCPMRAANLASLDLNRHLISSRSGTHTMYSIRIEGVDVKNRQPIEVELSRANSAVVHQYITKFRGNISRTKTTALFPQRGSSEPRLPGNLSAELSQRIDREVGLKVNAHLFRHLAAKLYLDAYPGNYETVRRLLKHKNIQTTIDFYAEMSSQHAHDSYSAILTTLGGRDE